MIYGYDYIIYPKQPNITLGKCVACGATVYGPELLHYDPRRSVPEQMSDNPARLAQ